MLALPLYLVFTSILVWGFFAHELAAWVFVALACTFAAWLILSSVSLGRRTPHAGAAPFDFSPEEVTVCRRYAFYFRYPFQAQQYSGAFTCIQLLSFVWVALMLWRNEWLLAATFGFLAFAAFRMAVFLNPGNFLRSMQNQGKLTKQLLGRLHAVEGVEEKVTRARQAHRPVPP